MILSNRDILDRLGDTVIIYPFQRKNLNTSSYDVCLGDNYYLFTGSLDSAAFNIYDFEEVKSHWVRFRALKNSKVFPGQKVIWVPPRGNLLAHTIEFIGGRKNVTTMMKARSSIGRNLIMVCACAGFGDIGYFNRWTMEITNKSDQWIPLLAGRRIAQIVFMQTGDLFDGAEDYTAQGKYQQECDISCLREGWNPEMMLPRLDKDRESDTSERRPDGDDVPGLPKG